VLPPDQGQAINALRREPVVAGVWDADDPGRDPWGWSPAEKAGLLDAMHAAAVEALRIPDEDRRRC
jgi:hypothetical protein